MQGAINAELDAYCIVFRRRWNASCIADVTDRSQVEQIVEQVRDRFGVIDILINNAGTDLIGPMDVLTMEDYDDLMKLHFWAPLYTTYAVLPEMRQRQAGRIVNISSIGGKVVSPHMLAYCASKFALTGLSEGMRAELAKKGIAVTTVCPGFIRTGVIDHVIFKGEADQPVETERPHRQVEAQRVVIGEADSFGIARGTPSPEPAIAEDDQSGFPLIEPSQAPSA